MFYLIQSEVEVEGTVYATYGIRNNEIVVEDISTDKDAIENFISLLNEAGDVESCHLMDIIEDFIG